MTILLYTVHVLICLFLIAVVLLQQGSGADLSVFGGGATQTAFGARGAATVLHKMTVVSFVLFIITTLAIGVVHTHSGESSVLGTLPDAEQAEATADEAAEDGSAAAEENAEDVQGALPMDDGTTDASGDEADAATEDGAAEDGAADDGSGGSEDEGEDAGTEGGGDQSSGSEG